MGQRFMIIHDPLNQHSPCRHCLVAEQASRDHPGVIEDQQVTGPDMAQQVRNCWC